jgi:hypothetical protein
MARSVDSLAGLRAGYSGRRREPIEGCPDGRCHRLRPAHLAYATADDGIGRLRTLLRTEPHYAPVLTGFEAIDRGRRMLEDRTASAAAKSTARELIWAGNVQLLEHEQRALVQPHFDHLSCAFARLVSMGSVTTFEVHGVRREMAYFTSFYLYAFTRGMPNVLRMQAWPRMTQYDARWGWLLTSVVPASAGWRSTPG